MSEVGSLNAKLTLDMSDFSAGMEQAVQLAQALSRELSSAMAGNPFAGLNQSIAETEASVRNLQAEISSFQASLQSVSGADMFASVKTYTSEIASDIERANGALDTFLHGAQSSAEAFQNLREAINTFSTVDAETGEIVGNGDDISVGFATVYQNAQLIVTELQRIEALLQNCVQLANQLAQAMRETSRGLQNTSRALDLTATHAHDTASAVQGASNSAKKFANNTEKAKKGLQTSKGYAVSIKQVIAGIVISQTFYSLLGTLEQAIGRAREFTATIEEANIKLSYLFGASEKNADVSIGAYVNQMKELSLQTGLSAATLMEDAEQLQAMGFTARASIPAVAILSDTTAIFSGNLSEANTQMTYLIKALGQMLSSGHVSAQELRQLYNAGLPIYDILAKALNLSVEEARNIGKLNYDSATAVYGILKELQRRYGGASQDLTHTFNGAINVIKEGLTQIIDYAWRNVFSKLSNWLDKVAQWVKALAKIGQAYGPGGIFQALFPAEAWEPIRQLLSALKLLAASVKNVFQIVAGSLLSAFKGLLPIFAAAAQRIASVAYALTTMLKYAIQNVPVLRKILTLIAGLTICNLVAKLVTILAKALYVLSGAKLVVTSLAGIIKGLIGLAATSPGVVAAILAIAAAFTILYSTCGVVRDFINGTFEKLSNTTKKFAASLSDAFDTNKILQPEFTRPETDDWSAGLQDLIDGWDDLGDAEDEATKKKKKYLQSFDEVFTINDNDDDDAAGGLMDIADALKELGNLSLIDPTQWLGDWDLDWGAISSGLEGIGSGAFNLKDAFSSLTAGLDLSTMATDIWDNLKSALMANPDFVGGSLGGAIGAILGGLMGGKAGAIIGAALGTLTGTISGKFWNMLAEAFGVGPEEASKATIASSIVGGLGLIIGKAVGGAGTGLLFSLIGGAAAGLVELVWGVIQNAFGFSNSTKITQILTSIGEGLVTGIQKFFSSWGSAKLVTAFAGANGATTETMATMLSQGLKISLKEGLTKGFAGALGGIGISFASDALVGWVGKASDKSAEDIKSAGTWASWGGTILSIVGGILGTFVFPGLGTLAGSLIGQAVGNLLGGFGRLFADELGTFFGKTIPKALKTAWKAVSKFFVEDVPAFFSSAFDSIASTLSSAWEGIVAFFTDTIPNFFAGIGESISTAFSTAWDGVKTFFTETIPTWWTNLGEGLKTFFTETIPNVLYDAGYAIGYALATIALAVKTFFTETIPTLWENFTTALTTFFTVTIPTAWNNFVQALEELFVTIGNALVTFFTETIPNAWNDFTTALNTFFTETIPNAWDAFTQALEEFFTKVGNAVVNFLTKTIPNAWNNFTTALKHFFTVTIPNAWNNFITSLGNFFTKVTTKVVTFFTVTLPEKWNAFIQSVKELGQRIIDGLISGLTGAADTVWGWIKGFGKGFIDGFKDVFGIASPAKEMKPIGKYILAGVTEGMETESDNVNKWIDSTFAPDVVKSISDIANDAGSAAQGIGSAITDAMSPKELSTGNVFSNLDTAEQASLDSLQSWTTQFVSIITNMVTRIAEMFDLMDVRIMNAANALTNTSSNINANMGSIRAGRELLPTTGTPTKMYLAEETVDLLAAKMSERAYEYFAPMLATDNSNQDARSVAYVGTLIADERSLKELNRKLQVIQLNENTRRGK